MKQFFTLFLFLFLFTNISAQESCATPQSKPDQTYEISDLLDNQYCINIKFHIVRQSNGTGGFDSNQISNVVNLLNQYYNPHSINIVSIGFDFINNSNLYNIDDTGNSSTEFNQLIAQNNDPNAINFYIVNNANYYGRAQDIQSKNLVVTANRALTSTAPHELGHCFNLYHTFTGTLSGTGGCSENIDGSNCTLCGDYICDTPADANTGNTNGYNPDLTNFMSYYSFRDHFTAQQGARMRNAIAGASILQSVRSTNCGGISGNPNLCYLSSYTYQISNPSNYSVNWTSSTNLTLSNPTNSSVTVSSNNSSYNGIATISATYNGTTYSKDIWVGKPEFGVTQINNPSYYSESHFYISTNTALDLQGVTQIKWTKLSATKPGTHLFANLNEEDGWAEGIDNNWQMQVKVDATNSCGTTTQIVIITPPTSVGCDQYVSIANISKNNFQAIIIDPCANASSTFAQKSTITSIDLAEVYDVKGNKVVEFKNNTFDLTSLNEGVYLIKIYIGRKISSHKIIIK